MRKRHLLVLAFGLLLAFSGYAQSGSEAQSESKGSFFLSGGIYNGFFDSPIFLLPHFEMKKLFAAMASVNYEIPVGPGLTAFGLEAGYSSGSRFGGKGNVDFLPFDLSAAYVFPLATNFYIGPKLKIGGLGLLGSRNDVVLMAGARLEAELRSAGFPFGLFVAGGIDIFPTAPEFATLPVIEVGLRFPRGKTKKSGSQDTAKKDTGGSRDNSSGQNAAAVTPGATTGTGTGTSGSGTAVGQPGGTGATQGTTGGTQNQSTAGAPTAGAPTAGTPSTGQGTSATQNQTPGSATVPAASATGQGTGSSASQSTGVGQTPSSPATSQGTGSSVTQSQQSTGAGATGTGATQSQTPAAPATVGSGTVGSGLTGTVQVQNRNIILDDGKQGILNAIYFEPDTAVLIESYRSILDAVGRQLAADPGLKLLIRAYAANFGTADGRYLVSANRARFSRDFFTSQYGISASRFNIEAFGADKSPVFVTDDWQSHRCVELILFRD